MALMFSRLARNFIKNGYFPTDELTLERLCAIFELAEGGSHRLLDPCCGEGCALAELRNALIQQRRAANGDDSRDARDAPTNRRSRRSASSSIGSGPGMPNR